MMHNGLAAIPALNHARHFHTLSRICYYAWFLCLARYFISLHQSLETVMWLIGN